MSWSLCKSGTVLLKKCADGQPNHYGECHEMRKKVSFCLFFFWTTAKGCCMENELEEGLA